MPPIYTNQRRFHEMEWKTRRCTNKLSNLLFYGKARDRTVLFHSTTHNRCSIRLRYRC